MTNNTTQQPAAPMFDDFSDLSLFSGTPIAVEGEHFSPPTVPAERQAEMPGFEQPRDWQALSDLERQRKAKKKAARKTA